MGIKQAIDVGKCWNIYINHGFSKRKGIKIKDTYQLRTTVTSGFQGIDTLSISGSLSQWFLNNGNTNPPSKENTPLCYAAYNLGQVIAGPTTDYTGAAALPDLVNLGALTDAYHNYTHFDVQCTNLLNVAVTIHVSVFLCKSDEPSGADPYTCANKLLLDAAPNTSFGGHFTQALGPVSGTTLTGNSPWGPMTMNAPFIQWHEVNGLGKYYKYLGERVVNLAAGASTSYEICVHRNKKINMEAAYTKFTNFSVGNLAGETLHVLHRVQGAVVMDTTAGKNYLTPSPVDVGYIIRRTEDISFAPPSKSKYQAGTIGVANTATYSNLKMAGYSDAPTTVQDVV